jgi:hypothetical protein
MKIMRLLLPTFILLIAASGALADSKEPRIVMGGHGSCQSFVETSLTQKFHVETETGGCVGGVDFTNEINDGTVTLDLLVVNVDTPFMGALSCVAGTGSPLATAFLSSPTSCTFEDEEETRSIPPGGLYNLNFLNDSSGSWPKFIDITLAQTVIPTPEPASMLLLGIGLMGFLAGSKSRGWDKRASRSS